jgi:hypothetical protein
MYGTQLLNQPSLVAAIQLLFPLFVIALSFALLDEVPVAPPSVAAAQSGVFRAKMALTRLRARAPRRCCRLSQASAVALSSLGWPSSSGRATAPRPRRRPHRRRRRHRPHSGAAARASSWRRTRRRCGRETCGLRPAVCSITVQSSLCERKHLCELALAWSGWRRLPSHADASRGTHTRHWLHSCVVRSRTAASGGAHH